MRVVSRRHIGVRRVQQCDGRGSGWPTTAAGAASAIGKSDARPKPRSVHEAKNTAADETNGTPTIRETIDEAGRAKNIASGNGQNVTSGARPTKRRGRGASVRRIRLARKITNL